MAVSKRALTRFRFGLGDFKSGRNSASCSSSFGLLVEGLRGGDGNDCALVISDEHNGAAYILNSLSMGLPWTSCSWKATGKEAGGVTGRLELRGDDRIPYTRMSVVAVADCGLAFLPLGYSTPRRRPTGHCIARSSPLSSASEAILLKILFCNHADVPISVT